MLVVDGDTVLATPDAALKGASVTARVVGEAKGPKIIGFTYKNKTNQRKRWGHRQHYATIEITGITGLGADDVEDQRRRLHPQRPRLQTPSASA